MENKKDIGKAFREKLKDLNQTPDDKLWNAIRADLQKRKKRRFIFLFWMTTAGFLFFSVGALFVVFPEIMIGFNKNLQPLQWKNERQIRTDVNENGTNQEDKSEISTNDTSVGRSAKVNKYIFNGEKNSSVEQKKNNEIDTANELNSKSNYIRTRKFSKKLTKSNEHFNSSDKTEIESQNRNVFGKSKKLPKKQKNSIVNSRERKTTENEKSLVTQSPENKELSIQIEETDTVEQATATTEKGVEDLPINPKKTDSVKTPAKKVLKEPTKDSVQTKENLLEKIKIFVYGSPTYGKYLSNSSTIDKSLDHNPTTGKISLSYGAYAIYEATPKWSLRFGIRIKNLQFETKDAVNNRINFKNINYTNSLSNADIYEKSNQSETMDIIQTISYTEIPLELKYVIRNRKFGLNAFGGLSYRFLCKNEVSVTAANGAKFNIGETKNLSSNAYSINAGIGLDYKFSEFVQFNFEPVFQLYLFDYKNNAVNPYTIGIMAGLQFSLKK